MQPDVLYHDSINSFLAFKAAWLYSVVIAEGACRFPSVMQQSLVQRGVMVLYSAGVSFASLPVCEAPTHTGKQTVNSTIPILFHWDSCQKNKPSQTNTYTPTYTNTHSYVSHGVRSCTQPQLYTKWDHNHLTWFQSPLRKKQAELLVPFIQRKN